MIKPTIIWRHDAWQLHPKEHLDVHKGRVCLCFQEDYFENPDFCQLPEVEGPEVGNWDDLWGSEHSKELILQLKKQYPCLHVQPIYKFKDFLSLVPIDGKSGDFYPPVEDDYFMAGLWLFPMTPGEKWELDVEASDLSFKIWSDWSEGMGILCHKLHESYEKWWKCQSLEILEDEYQEKYLIREAIETIIWR